MQIFVHTSTQTGEPNSPTNLTILFNNSVITLSWDPPDINSGCIFKYIVYISGETEVYTVSTPTLEITPDQLSLNDTYYFNVVSIDNIGRSGNYSENSTLFSISKIC